VHVTLRMREHVWNLRSRRSFAVVERALAAVNRRPDFGVVHFSVQGNHLHLVVEARDRGAFSSGVRALGTRLALGLNRMMERRGPVLADRFHAHLLTTPAEARNALAYVLDNFRGHAVRRGERPGPPVPDRYASTARPASGASALPPEKPRPWWHRRAGFFARRRQSLHGRFSRSRRLRARLLPGTRSGVDVRIPWTVGRRWLSRRHAMLPPGGSSVP
jgi:REP element-mobilizing transposase RayT